MTTQLWRLTPGDTIVRAELNRRFGGNSQSGISPSRKSANVFIFSDPASGQQHGYLDDWDGDVLHYYGEGQRGDQQITNGNKAILNHIDEGRSLRVFQGVGGNVTYLGEFELDAEEPSYWARAPETAGGPQRRVIVFKLKPLDYSPASVPQQVSLSTPYRAAKEGNKTKARDPFEVDPDAVDRSLSTHAKLQNKLADHVRSQGGEVLSPGALDPGFDAAWRKGSRSWVAEVKSLTTANEVKQLRLGLGQILHYQALLSEQRADISAVLFIESEPSDRRWIDLCSRHGVQLIWPRTLHSLPLS